MIQTITYDDTQWQLVPKDPTFEMEEAGENSGPWCVKQYKAMLSASPTPPAQPKQPPGFHNCTFSNEPVQTAVFIVGESAQTPEQPVEQPPIPESLWRSILDAGLTLHKEGDKWWVEKVAQPAERIPLTPHRISTWGHCSTCRHSKIPGEGCTRGDCPEAAHGITEP